MNETKEGVFTTPIGNMRVVVEGDFIKRITLTKQDVKTCNSPLFLKAKGALEDYFYQRSETFDLPLDLTQGTPFQQRVWHGLLAMPYQETISYKALANTVGISRGFQAVAQAVGRNPYMIVLPCHRVIGSDQSLTGYAHGTHIKERLLKFEKGQSL